MKTSFDNGGPELSGSNHKKNLFHASRFANHFSDIFSEAVGAGGKN